MEDGTVTRMDDDVRLETLNEAKAYIAAELRQIVHRLSLSNRSVY